MNLEELRALTPEERDAILAKQSESMTPVERLMVYLNQDNHEDDAQAVAIVDDLMIAYVLTTDPLTPGAEELRDMLVEVIEAWHSPTTLFSKEDYRPAWIAAMAERDAEIRETDALKSRLVDAAKEINALRVQVANLESQVAAAAEPWMVQSAMLNAVTTERDRFKNCLEYIAKECDYEETIPTKRWLQQVAADALNPLIDHHD